MPPAIAPDTAAPRRWPSLLLLGAVLLLALAYPLWQLATGAPVVYTNGFDEHSYLQYDFSREVQSATRPGQYLVTLGHELGLSGGRLNLLFDLGTLCAFWALVTACFRRLGWASWRAAAGALLLLGAPLLLGTLLPPGAALFEWNVRSGAIAWLNVPDLHGSALLRSPEPQASFVLLGLGIYAALRFRTIWPAYVPLPLLYPFVAIPAAFVVLACHLHARSGRPLGALAAAAAAVLAAAWAYDRLLVSDRLHSLMVPSAWPLVSLSALVALAIYALLRSGMPPALRFPALAIALSPLVASNQQLLTGYLAQPINFERYAGTFAVALVLAIALANRRRLLAVAALVALLLFARAGLLDFKLNHASLSRLPQSPALVEALRTDAAHTVVDDITLSDTLNLMHPKQPALALGYNRTFVALADRVLPDYLCVKQRILLDHPRHAGLRWILGVMDHAFEYSGQDDPVTTSMRRQTFVKLREATNRPCPHAELPTLHYFFVKP